MTESLNQEIQEYRLQLQKGYLQKAYKGIMAFMSELKTMLGKKYPEYIAGALYLGFMDMTYFAFTPPSLKTKNLKIAIVYLHEEGRFEGWLGGINRKIQAEYIRLLSQKQHGNYTLSRVQPGVDSILESILVDDPDFDHPEELKQQIESKITLFIQDVTIISNEA
jgi:hypothetical protein